MPPLKPWVIADKQHLQKLINKGKVDITKIAEGDYIDQVRLNHICHQEAKNFRHNFCNYARSRELEDHLSGYPQEQGGGKVLILPFNSCYDYI
jgi:hypothetical protein